MFCLHEKIVYPGHGVAQIRSLVNKSFGQEEATFYELVFLNKEMTILVPTESAAEVGLRLLSSHEHVKQILDTLMAPVKFHQLEQISVNWNKRNKEYQLKLKSGKLQELSDMYRELHCLAAQKELSFGEKNLLHQIEGLLVEEIALVEKMAEEKTLEQLRTVCMAQAQKMMVEKMV